MARVTGGQVTPSMAAFVCLFPGPAVSCPHLLCSANYISQAPYSVGSQIDLANGRQQREAERSEEESRVLLPVSLCFGGGSIGRPESPLWWAPYLLTPDNMASSLGHSRSRLLLTAIARLCIALPFPFPSSSIQIPLSLCPILNFLYWTWYGLCFFTDTLYNLISLSV